MVLFIDVVLIILFAILAFQDFKYRAITWYLLPMIFCLLFYKSKFLYANYFALKNIFFNLIFLIVQFVGITIYFSFKNKKFYNIVDTAIGLGDVLLLVAFCAAFSPLNFMVFYISSSVVSLIVFGLIIIFKKNKEIQIPLAGMYSVLFSLLLIASYLIHPVNLYDDDLIYNYLM